MSSQLDKALLDLSLEEEEDVPFLLPDTPEYCSAGRNSLSLVGRLLNPSYQKMSDLILDMPRKWQLYDRVRGVALSRERFQFIFKYEHDLLDILNRGVHTFKLWPLVMERWVEKPPEDYLQHIMVWVQMRNIPVNHYTKKALWALGDFAGQVVEVAFDPEKPQVKDYIRVLVKFNVARPLRRFKTVTTPGGEEIKIRYDYERLQKRCYTCQRLTHERDDCPFFLKKKEDLENAGASSAESKKLEALERLDENDPLCGIIPETLLGRDAVSGKPKINEDVMEGMRTYLAVVEGPEREARVERVKKSLLDLENDPIGRKTALMLEPEPRITKDLDKGKGVVFDFSKQSKGPISTDKLMASAITAGACILQSGKVVTAMLEPDDLTSSTFSLISQKSSTGFTTGFFETSMSGTNLKKGRARKRPGTFKRRNNGKAVLKEDKDTCKKIGEGVMTISKRKAKDDVEPSQSSARFKKPLVVPSEGPSNI
ncbi:uncharacterized protein LOC108844853 [Raphanus sativus]|uniref:Uncharacterized protein LOC108844853 n=1 Tax=Raphanus sativus TaxID=3726 RepID=A0A6J0MMC4_RAPSA|nr:uncharacterized protein LOC108844853 [Raphanus sativus]